MNFSKKEIDEVMEYLEWCDGIILSPVEKITMCYKDIKFEYADGKKETSKRIDLKKFLKNNYKIALQVKLFFSFDIAGRIK